MGPIGHIENDERQRAKQRGLLEVIFCATGLTPLWCIVAPPNRAMTLFTPVCTYIDRVRSAEVLQYQCMGYRASKHHSAASPHDCFSKCWIARKVGKR
jgi:hypothetical protein